MSEFVMKHAGADLLRLLQDECQLAPPAARAFLESRCGVIFDPKAEYCVAYDQGSTGEHWSRNIQLRIWRVADAPHAARANPSVPSPLGEDLAAP